MLFKSELAYLSEPIPNNTKFFKSNRNQRSNGEPMLLVRSLVIKQTIKPMKAMAYQIALITSLRGEQAMKSHIYCQTQTWSECQHFNSQRIYVHLIIHNVTSLISHYSCLIHNLRVKLRSLAVIKILNWITLNVFSWRRLCVITSSVPRGAVFTLAVLFMNIVWIKMNDLCTSMYL